MGRLVSLFCILAADWEGSAYHRLFVHEIICALEHRIIQLLSEPDDTRPLETNFAGRALGKLIPGDGVQLVVWIK